MKLTDWFDGSKFVPAHVGVYLRDYSDEGDHSDTEYCKWNGMHWMVCSGYVDEANYQYCESLFQNFDWRGLAEQPK